MIKLVGTEVGIKGKISKEHKKMIQKQMKYVLKGKTSHLLDSEDLKNLRNACSHVFSRLDGNLTTEKKMIKLVGTEVGIKGKISKEHKELIRKQMKYVLKKKASRQQDSKDLKDDNSYIGAEASSGEVEGILTNENKHKRKRKHINNEEKPVRDLRKRRRTPKKGTISQEVRSNESKTRHEAVSLVDVCEGESFGGSVSASRNSATEHSSQIVEKEVVDASKQRVKLDVIGIISADSEKNQCSIYLDSNMTKITSIEPLTNRSESYRSGSRQSMRLLRSREKLLDRRSDSSSTNKKGDSFLGKGSSQRPCPVKKVKTLSDDIRDIFHNMDMESMTLKEIVNMLRNSGHEVEGRKNDIKKQIKRLFKQRYNCQQYGQRMQKAFDKKNCLDSKTFLEIEEEERLPTRTIALPDRNNIAYTNPLSKTKIKELSDKKILNWNSFHRKLLNDYKFEMSLKKLIDYKEKHGHTCVPHKTKLGIWVAHVRQLYIGRLAGESNSLSDTRIRLLNDIDFVWSMDGWMKSFENLKELQLNVSYSFVFLGKCYN